MRELFNIQAGNSERRAVAGDFVLCYVADGEIEIIVNDRPYIMRRNMSAKPPSGEQFTNIVVKNISCTTAIELLIGFGSLNMVSETDKAITLAVGSVVGLDQAQNTIKIDPANNLVDIGSANITLAADVGIDQTPGKNVVVASIAPGQSVDVGNTINATITNTQFGVDPLNNAVTIDNPQDISPTVNVDNVTIANNIKLAQPESIIDSAPVVNAANAVIVEPSNLYRAHVSIQPEVDCYIGGANIADNTSPLVRAGETWETTNTGDIWAKAASVGGAVRVQVEMYQIPGP